MTAPGEAGREVLDILREERARHRRLTGDYRTGYGFHCDVCSVQHSQPGYNERVSWREAEDWPCKTSVALDEAIVALAALDQARRDGAAKVLRPFEQLFSGGRTVWDAVPGGEIEYVEVPMADLCAALETARAALAAP